MELKTVHIMRGLPGAGKSTYVKDNLLASYVCSADDFFMVPERWQPEADGPLLGPRLEYKFDVSKLAEAHNACLTKFIKAVSLESFPSIVVDNTHVHLWEYRHYVMLAKEFGYRCVIHELRPETLDQVRIAANRCIHNVPPDIVARMAFEWEPAFGAEGMSINGQMVHVLTLQSQEDYEKFLPITIGEYGAE